MFEGLKVFSIPLEGVGIENNRTYYAQGQKPFLTINFEHTSRGLLQRQIKIFQHNRFLLGTASFREQSVNLFLNPSNNAIEYSVGKIWDTSNIQSTTFTTRQYLQSFQGLFFNQRYFFFHKPFAGNSIILRFNPATSDFTLNPYTLPTTFSNKYFTAGKYANRIFISHPSEPLLAYTNTLAIQGTMTEFDLFGIGSNSPVVFIGSASFSQIGAFRTFLVLVQEDGTILVYQGIDPAFDFQLVYFFKLDGFLPQIAPVTIGSDIFLFSTYGCFSLASLLNSTGLDFLNLNIFKEIQPFYERLISRANYATYNFLTNSLQIFGTGGLDLAKPIFNIPNINRTQYMNLNFITGGIWSLSFNFLTTAISYVQYEDINSHSLTFDSQNLNLKLTYEMLAQPNQQNLLKNYLCHYVIDVN